MDLKSMIGWFGLMLAAGCVMVGLVAVFVGLSAADPDRHGSNDLMLPIAMLFLKPVAVATMATGAVGLFWPADTDPDGHSWRCWAALLVGAVAAAISFMFGPTY